MVIAEVVHVIGPGAVATAVGKVVFWFTVTLAVVVQLFCVSVMVMV